MVKDSIKFYIKKILKKYNLKLIKINTKKQSSSILKTKYKFKCIWILGYFAYWGS